MEFNNGSPISIDRFHEIELENLFERIQTREEQRIQIASFFAAANFAAISLAISTQTAGLMVLSSSLLLGQILAVSITRRLLIISYLRLFRLQALYAPEDKDFQVFYATGKLGVRLSEVQEMPPERQIAEVRRSFSPRHASIPGFWLPLLLAVVEIAMGLFFWVQMGWSIF